jgi:decaprenylphospho-beta-D-erythro-pentofuranosid-2-ulose 2-reductase
MNILIIGATSAIAKATARHYAVNNKASFFLVARNADALDELQQDLQVRGAAKVISSAHDMNDDHLYQKWIEEAFQSLGSIDIVLMAHGILGNQKACEADVFAMKEMMKINALSSLEMLTIIANKMQEQGSGTIAFISSVAGDRGRPSNYVYGASKAVVTTFLQGLRARMAKVGVHVLTIKPGFVDTPMTAAIDKGGPLWAQPEDIAIGIAKAIEKRKNTVYLPWFWRIIMAIIIHIPETIFKKLNL